MFHTFCVMYYLDQQIHNILTIKPVSYFYVHMTVHRDKFLVIKPTRCTNFSNLFRNETLNVSDSSSVHHQDLFTVHSAMVYVIQTAFEQQQDQDGTAVPF
jgi:UDP-N-acetylglucosamine 2-epimerase